MPKRLTIEEFREQLEREHPNLELLSEYKGNKNYVTVRCKIHEYTFETKPNWLHCRHGCMKCYQERNGKDRLKSMDKFMIITGRKPTASAVGEEFPLAFYCLTLFFLLLQKY